MEIPGLTQTRADIPVIEADQIGFAGLDSNGFLKLLITELQNQDPLSPLESGDMLNQLSMMRNLQASIELSDSIKAITSNQQLSTAAAFIGKEITGADAAGNEVIGMVDRAFLRDSKAFVGVGEVEVSLSQVISVNAV